MSRQFGQLRKAILDNYEKIFLLLLLILKITKINKSRRPTCPIFLIENFRDILSLFVVKVRLRINNYLLTLYLWSFANSQFDFEPSQLVQIHVMKSYFKTVFIKDDFIFEVQIKDVFYPPQLLVIFEIKSYYVLVA